jgi:hypothetical protein
VTTHAPLRSRRTKAESVYHVQVRGDGDVPTSPIKIQGWEMLWLRRSKGGQEHRVDAEEEECGSSTCGGQGALGYDGSGRHQAGQTATQQEKGKCQDKRRRWQPVAGQLPDGSRRHNRQQAHQQQDDTPPDVVKSPPWHSTKIAADQQGRRG